MEKRKALGTWGENLAKKYLLKNGYIFIAQNYRVNRQELDLIVKKNEQLIFVEVKTRQKNYLSEQENPLSAKQTDKLKSALIKYCLEIKWPLEKTRLDLIIIIADNNTRQAYAKIYQDILR